MGTYNQLRNLKKTKPSTKRSPGLAKKSVSKTSIRRSDVPTKRRSDDPTIRRSDTTRKKAIERIAFDFPIPMAKEIRKAKAMREIQEGRSVA
jgi:hypothetical protein